MATADVTCSHADQIEVMTSDTHVCEDCVKEGTRWMHLRMCLTCGHVACCDSSPRKHATAHFKSTQHPLMRSQEPGENWVWCYVHEDTVGEIN